MSPASRRPWLVLFAPGWLCLWVTSMLGASAEGTNAWAFRPLTRPPIPIESRTGKTPLNPIDGFIHQRLRTAGLSPAPAADRPTLLRRLTFDLTGLPPTPDEIAAFVADRHPDALGRCADRLLASPRYGERWARHWLDVVRFGESQGFEYDRIRDNAWRYRDYVITAFNTDKPYDRFIREQLAGDVLEPVTQEGIVATGFLVAGPWDQAGSGASSASIRAMVRESEMEDMVGTIGQTFLGVTLNCARCHNHKFDPIPQRDYYRVKAVFDGIHHGDRSVLGTAEIAERKERRGNLDRERLACATEIEQLEDSDARRASAQFASAQAATAFLPSAHSPPSPLARWSFAAGLTNTAGRIGGRLMGNAKIQNGRLVLDGGKSFLISESLERPLTEKTLEAWVRLSDLDQRGAGIVSLETPNGARFDAIVYGERQPRQWTAGSEGFVRTRDLNAAAEESDPTTPIHLAITYAADGTQTVYRNGKPLAAPWRPDSGRSPLTEVASTRVLIGCRHTGGTTPFLNGEVEEVRLYDRGLSAEEILTSFNAGPAGGVSREQRLAALTPEERTRLNSVTQRHQAILAALKELDAPPMGYAANPSQPVATFVLLRGEPDKPRESVTPGGLSAVQGLSAELDLDAKAPESERRRRFADWVARPDNPLTARTIVNRVWHYHFHRGLVGTPNDLGRMGDTPSHPELLEWLASWFVAKDGGNWSLKRLHRLIVTSETWQQSSVQDSVAAASRDAENRLLWRFTPRRLEAEETRDALLALGGELNPAMGGPGYRPFRHVGNGGQNEYFAADLPGPEFNRRTVYRLSVHSARDPLLDALDCPELSTRTAVRPNTTTPLQALSLMNNSFVLRQASRMADRASTAGGGKAAIRRMWQLALGRPPRPAELNEALRLAREQEPASVGWVLMNSNEFMFVR
jgi:hypothetical protein